MKRHIVISAILLLVAATASAQMTHRPPSNGTPPNGGSNMGNAGEMCPMHLAVASDGTVVVIDRDVSGRRSRRRSSRTTRVARRLGRSRSTAWR